MITPPEFLHLPAWHEGDGPAPFVWSKMPAGNRCAWSCVWYVNYHDAVRRVFIRDWGTGLEPQNMSETELYSELEDIAARHVTIGNVAQAAELCFNHGQMDAGLWRTLVEQLIAQARQLYPSYLAEWLAPNPKLFEMRPKERPGWSVFPKVEPEAFTPEPPEKEGKGVLLRSVELSTPTKRRGR